MAAELPKVTNDVEHNAAYVTGNGLISPHLKLLEREPMISDKARRDLSEGISYLKAVTDYNQQNWAAYWIIGKAYQALGNHIDANGSFRSSYKIQTQNPDVAREYALSCLELGFGDEAVQATKKSISLAPKDAGLYANLALAHLIANQNREALHAVNVALNMSPNDKISQAVKKIVIEVIAGKRRQPKNGADL